MANTPFSSLPPAIVLQGNEIVAVSVPTGNAQAPFVSERTTVAAIANFWLTINASIVTRHQLYSALAAGGNMATIFQAVSADVNSQNWVDFNTLFLVSITSNFAAFIKSTLGYNDAQMMALYQQALAYTP